MERSDVHLPKADAAMHESLEPDSKLTLDSAAQSSKHCTESVSTDEGMQIDARAEQHTNAFWPIVETFAGDSNVIVESLSQFSKQ
jgi:hypothetical protein